MKLNIGLVIQITTLLVGLGVTYGALRGQVDALEKKVDQGVDAVELEKRLGEIQGEQRAQGALLRELIERDRRRWNRR